MGDKKRFKLILFNALTFILLFVIQYNGAFSIKLGGANPMLPLCICIAFSMFSGELYAVIFALITGVITDGAAATPVCFNTIVFILISLGVSLTVRYLFNNNIRSATVIGITGGGIYYLLRFIFCMPKAGAQNTVGYLLSYALPSVIYTAIIVIPLFYLEKRLFAKYYAR